MSTTYKVLGQVNPTAATDTLLYTVPAATSTVVSTLTVCNQSGAPALFRVAVRPAGVALTAVHYLAYDTVLNQNDMLALTLGITLAATDVVSVRASTTTVSFALFGSELA
jgi:hypothetical protein